MKKGSKHTEQTKEAISKAMEENNNAEVWALEDADKLFDRAFEMVEDEELYIVAGGIKVDGYKHDFIGTIVRELREEYKNFGKVGRKLLSDDLPNRFPHLKDRYNALLSELETNCYENTKKGKINTAIGIVNLKSNHKWTDRTESKNDNTTTTTIINLGEGTPPTK
jgi:hypothetical protein